MLALLSEMARSEAETLLERINSGLAEARRKGVKLGRPEGTKISLETLMQTHGTFGQGARSDIRQRLLGKA